MALLAYGMAASAILMVTGNAAFGKTVPPLLGKECDLLLRVDASIWGGFPIGSAGLLTIGGILLGATGRRTLLFARILAFAGGTYAVWLQFRVAALLGASCGWCVLAAVSLTLGAVALLFVRRPWPVVVAPVILFGVAIPAFVAAFVRIPTPPRETLALTSINRSQVTGQTDSSRREIVLFASPESPASRSEVRALASRFPLGTELIVRFVPVVGTRDERRLAALAYIATNTGRGDVLRIIFSNELVNVRTGLAERMLIPDPASLRVAYRRVDYDALSARALKIAEPPFIVECPPDAACRRVDPGTL